MTNKREQLVRTAVELFSAHGFHGVGIDRIAEAAGVSKKTMYHHFRSKEDLIVAALRQKDSDFRREFVGAVEARAATPYARLLAVFDVAHDWFASNQFYGCMFINAIGEYSEPNTEIREVCKEYKRLMRSYIEQLAREAGVPDPERIALSVALLLEGSIVTAQVSETPDAARAARDAARVLIDAALAGVHGA